MPNIRHSSKDSLNKVQYLDLYLGALRLDDEERRLIALTMILVEGRLGLRIGEFIHMRRSWVDWEKGIIEIPEYDPCGCQYCWERSKDAIENNDSYSDPPREDDIEDHLYDERWRPKSEAGARPVPFNWSPRVTAALAKYFDDVGYSNKSDEFYRSLLEEVAENSETISKDGITSHALRATASTWWGNMGLNPKEKSDLFGWSRAQESTSYTAQSPHHLSDEMRDLVGLDGVEMDRRDPVSLTPSTFPREPFSLEVDRDRLLEDVGSMPLIHPRSPWDEGEYDWREHDSLVVEREKDAPLQERKEIMDRFYGMIAEADEKPTLEELDPYPTGDVDPSRRQGRLTESYGMSLGALGYPTTDDVFGMMSGVVITGGLWFALLMSTTLGFTKAGVWLYLPDAESRIHLPSTLSPDIAAGLAILISSVVMLYIHLRVAFMETKTSRASPADSDVL